MAWYDSIFGGWSPYINAFLLSVGWWLIPIITLFVYKKHLNKYPIEATIYEKRGENVIWSNDRLGRFERPVVKYRFKMSKDSIPIPQYDWVLQALYRPTNLFAKMINLLSGTIGQVTLFKYSSKQYKPIQVRLRDGSFKRVLEAVRNDKGEEVLINIYEPINPKQVMSKINFEVIDWDDINHMTQELRAVATRRSPLIEGIQRWFPIIAVVLLILALIIAGYYYKDIVTSAKPGGITSPDS